eukprot:GEMP01075074.1.p1 GENE.GEMP01075074.1~~GEMP01075074.1.p1  ORF type:complete len:148 (+),score=26.64 GEMP01075074.1:188-631(+)
MHWFCYIAPCAATASNLWCHGTKPYDHAENPWIFLARKSDMYHPLTFPRANMEAFLGDNNVTRMVEEVVNFARTGHVAPPTRSAGTPLAHVLASLDGLDRENGREVVSALTPTLAHQVLQHDDGSPWNVQIARYLDETPNFRAPRPD